MRQDSLKTLNSELQNILKQILDYDRMTQEDFINLVADSILTVGNETKSERESSVLMAFCSDLQELINLDIYSIKISPEMLDQSRPEEKIGVDHIRADKRNNFNNENIYFKEAKKQYRQKNQSRQDHSCR